MKWAVVYILTIALVNFGFSYVRELDILWSILVGTIFISRDLCQRETGQWVWLWTLVGGGISYLTSEPYVAGASVCAFLISETVDGVVFTLTKRPFKDRVVISSCFSVPVDTVSFLWFVNLLNWQLFVLQVACKLLAIFGVRRLK